MRDVVQMIVHVQVCAAECSEVVELSTTRGLSLRACSIATLQVQSFRLALTLRLEHALARSTEVSHVDAHPALS